MRVYTNNIFENHIENILISNCIENQDNLFNKNFYESVFFSNGNGIIKLQDIEEQINTICLVNTNAIFVIIQITTIDDDTRYYLIEPSTSKTVEYINIETVTIKSIIISLYQENADASLHVSSVMAGMSVDFPPHSPAKTHTIQNTHEQFFSSSGNYFVRYLPLKKYNEWTINFDFLSNSQKELISSFFDDNNYTPFLLQVWTEKHKRYSIETPLVIETVAEDGEKAEDTTIDISVAPNYFITNDGFSYPTSVSLDNENKQVIFTTEDFDNNKVITRYTYKKTTTKNNRTPKHQMTAGFYVCTNSALEYQKSNNHLYPWSTTLKLREVF